MPLHLEKIFNEEEKEGKKRKRGVPSIKVVAGVIGLCWMSPKKNREIAKAIGVSDSVISEAINSYFLQSNLIVVDRSDPKKKRVSYTVNFIGLVDYLTELMGNSFTGRKEEILYTIMNNRVNVGRTFLENFVLNEAYKKGLAKVRFLYEAIPELLILLVLSVDATAPRNKEYINFLQCMYEAISRKYENKEPLLFVWSGLLWFILER